MSSDQLAAPGVPAILFDEDRVVQDIDADFYLIGFVADLDGAHPLSRAALTHFDHLIEVEDKLRQLRLDQLAATPLDASLFRRQPQLGARVVKEEYRRYRTTKAGFRDATLTRIALLGIGLIYERQERGDSVQEITKNLGTMLREIGVYLDQEKTFKGYVPRPFAKSEGYRLLNTLLCDIAFGSSTYEYVTNGSS